MIIDLHSVGNDHFNSKKYDVCICGAGAAGITLALALSEKLNVVLLEGGGDKYTQESQSLYKGKNIGNNYFDLDACRTRLLGGSTNCWGGWCRTLSEIDFETKPYTKYSGWPITKADLDPYIAETNTILNVNAEEKFFSADGFPENDPLQAFRKSKNLQRAAFWWSEPVPRFGIKYRKELEGKKNLTCYLNANVVDINLHDSLSAVRQVEIRDYNDRSFAIRAKQFIVTMGGIENARILLTSNRQQKDGIGNNNGLVGRFFSEHPNISLGHFALKDHVRDYLSENWAPPPRSWSFFEPSKKFMYDMKSLNFGLRFEPEKPKTAYTFRDRLINIIRQSDFANDLMQKITGRRLRLDEPYEGMLNVAAEQEINPDSRVTLGSESDRFGKRRVVLDWQITRTDRRTVQQAAVRFAKDFATLDLGRVYLFDWLLPLDKPDVELPAVFKKSGEPSASYHHMCTTRMSATPNEGVVDRNQKIFDIANLYVSGSSVFSTGGHANPTYTIVQLALRLADHLNSRLLS